MSYFKILSLLNPSITRIYIIYGVIEFTLTHLNASYKQYLIKFQEKIKL